jgi:hypothetical protein
MYALKPVPPQPSRTRRAKPHGNPARPALRQPGSPNGVASAAQRLSHQKQASQKQAQRHRTLAYETMAKLAVNLTLSGAAIVALVQLLPYHATQGIKLQELQAAVKITDGRVQRVQTNFTNYFDPSQARENMQILTDRIDPSRRQIVWKAPAQPGAPAQATAPAN